MSRFYALICLLCLLQQGTLSADTLDKDAVSQFIDYMVSHHQYDGKTLESIFNKTNRSKRVLNAIARPAETLPWYKYRDIFIQDDRIRLGVKFWEENKPVLDKAEQEYGVPPHIIVAIIGVETRYGTSTGTDRVMDALATLAFHYPKRSSFFRNELEQYLLLTQEQDIDPLTLKGSYAGAMGIPQFIPSSYRRYAVDFNNDGEKDIWNDPADAIGSVANYFQKHEWIENGKVAILAETKHEIPGAMFNNDLSPHIKLEDLSIFGLRNVQDISPDSQLKLIKLDIGDKKEIWLGLKNFYVITRYNHSELYAMAVYQLANEILLQYERKSTAYSKN